MISARSFALAAIVGLLLGGCSGNGMTSTNPQTPASNGGVSEPGAMNAANSVFVGDVKSTNNKAAALFSVLGQAVNSDDVANGNASQEKPGKTVRGDDVASDFSHGVCRDGREFIVTENSTGTPIQTESKYFFDKGCTQLARDVVRTWTAGATAGSETVRKTASDYALHNTTPISVKNSTLNYTNGTFTKLGYTDFADGFVLEANNLLKIGTTKSISSDLEMVMQPASGSVNSYCTDSAGFNEIAIAKLDKEFGWSGGAFGSPTNTRTQNSAHSATWSSTHTGTAYSGASGALSIATGSANSSCPIATPNYTLSGGTSDGTYTIPITVTFDDGIISDLSISNATLHNGDTLNVATNVHALPASANFINGTITSGSTTVATFNVNAFGHGVLTVTKTGAQFVIVDWHVVNNG